jgi:hypothetical protein
MGMVSCRLFTYAIPRRIVNVISSSFDHGPAINKTGWPSKGADVAD